MTGHSGRSYLRPLSPLYRLGTRLRNTAYDRHWRATHDPGVPVLSVGNLTTGGTGKTPVARALAHLALTRGERPAILLRGYGARGSASPVPTWREAPPAGAIHVFGDEALAHTRALGGDVAVFAHKNRVASAARARAHGATLLILDDGFQHRALERRVDAVCLDWSAPLGRGGLLPAGDLREEAESLRRADVVFWTRWHDGDVDVGAHARVSSLIGTVPAVRWRYGPGRLRCAGTDHAFTPRRVVSATGVARPASVRDTLSVAGLDVVRVVSRRDHAPFDDAWCTAIDSAMHAGEADGIVITDKDEPRALSTKRGRAWAEAKRLGVMELTCEPLDDVSFVWKRLTAREREALER